MMAITVEESIGHQIYHVCTHHSDRPNLCVLKLTSDALHYSKGPCASDPTCLITIAYVLPGHVYPVVESWDTWEGKSDGEIHWMNCGSNTMQPRDGYTYRGLMGSACKQGYQSHYCLVYGFDCMLFFFCMKHSTLCSKKIWRFCSRSCIHRNKV